MHRIIYKNNILLIFILLFVLMFSGCEKEKPVKESKIIKENIEKETIKISVGAMITPSEGFNYYFKLLKYIERKLQYKVKYIDRKDYAEINSMLKSKDIDASFVCSGPNVEGHDDFGLELLVVPQAYGKTEYYSYIIIHSQSPINSLEELRGKTFAFTDPQSNTGEIVPTYILSTMNETPESFFKKTIFTYAHDKSIEAVANKIVDGAAVGHLVWKYMELTSPEVTAKTKIINKSQPFGFPPFVTRPGFDPHLKKRIKEILLHLHENYEGIELLKGIMIDKFVEVEDSHYNSIREMKSS